MSRPVSVFINGIRVIVQTGSFQAEGRIEERGTASFVVVDTDGTGSYSQNMPVAVYDGETDAPTGTLLFAGFIDTCDAVPIGVTDGLFHSVSGKNNTYLADKRLVVKSYSNKTLSYIVSDILTDYLAVEGITAGIIQTGPTIESAIFNYVSVTECFDALKELSGYIWRINHDKTLDFMDRSIDVAPWSLTAADVLAGSASRSIGNSLYRNRQYVRGGTGITSEQTENFTGDGVTVAFTVGYPFAQQPTVTVDSVSQTIGIKGIDTGMDCYWNKGDATITFALAPGAAEAIVVVYYGQYPLMARTESPSEIAALKAVEGGSGVVESIVTEAQHESSASILASAKGKIQEYCRSAEKFKFRTIRSGLLAGQLLPVTFSPFGYSSTEMLIESVSIQEEDNLLFYSVTVVTGPVLGSWTKLFSRMLSRQDKSIAIGDSLLLVLLVQNETLSLDEDTDLHSDDFSGGIVNRWIAEPPAQSKGHNIEHERLVLEEEPELTEAVSQGYAWG